MAKWFLTTLCAIAASLLLPVVVCAQVLPYESFEIQRFPDLSWDGDKTIARDIFPDYDQGVLVSSSYYEQTGIAGLTTGVVTIEVQRNCRVSLLYYSTGGMSYVLRNSMPLQGRQKLTSTFMLPESDPGGLTRLLLWEANADNSWIAFMARHPQQDLEPVPGMLAEAWFGRSAPGPVQYPWEDQYRPSEDFQTDYLLASDPLCIARLGSDGRAVSKDCAVRSSAPVRLASDEYGILGLWELDWSSRLNLTLELPPGQLPSRAFLVVYGSSGQPFGVSSVPAFEIAVNGWTLAGSLSVSPYEVSTQPVALDVSQYLQAGNNEISLQLSAFADNMWKVRRIELWTE